MTKPLKAAPPPVHSPHHSHHRAEVQTRIRDGGLRYASKPTGSPYPRDLGVMLSCFLCGRHRPQGLMKRRLLLGRQHVVCGDGCAQG